MQQIHASKSTLRIIAKMNFLLLLVWSGCMNESPLADTAEIKTTFRLSTTSALDGKVSIHEVYLKLDHIEARTMMNGQGLAIVSHDIPSADRPLQLTRPDSSYITFRIPATPYDQIIYDLYLFQDGYELILDSGPAPEPSSPPPVNNDEGSTGNEPDNGNSNNTPPPANDTPDDGDSAGENDNEGDNNDDADAPDNEPDSDDHGEGSGDDHEKKNKEKKKKKNKDNKGKKDDRDRRGQRVKDPTALSVNLDHFFQNARPSLVVFGTYNNNAQPLEIIFVVTGEEKLTLQSTGGENILLTTQNLAEAVFDPEAWFAPISISDIESAQRQLYQGREVLFIHKEINSSLYETLLTQFESTARLTFHTPPAP